MMVCNPEKKSEISLLDSIGLLGVRDRLILTFLYVHLGIALGLDRILDVESVPDFRWLHIREKARTPDACGRDEVR